MFSPEDFEDGPSELRFPHNSWHRFCIEEFKEHKNNLFLTLRVLSDVHQGKTMEMAFFGEKAGSRRRFAQFLDKFYPRDLLLRGRPNFSLLLHQEFEALCTLNPPVAMEGKKQYQNWDAFRKVEGTSAAKAVDADLVF